MRQLTENTYAETIVIPTDRELNPAELQTAAVEHLRVTHPNYEVIRLLNYNLNYSPVEHSYAVDCELREIKEPEVPKKISGYRELTQQEIDRVNAIKETERKFLKEMDTLDLQPETDKRHTALARTKMEEASMWAVKAITRPE